MKITHVLFHFALEITFPFPWAAISSAMPTSPCSLTRYKQIHLQFAMSQLDLDWLSFYTPTYIPLLPSIKKHKTLGKFSLLSLWIHKFLFLPQILSFALKKDHSHFLKMNMHKVLKQFTSQTDIIGLISLIEHFFFPFKKPLGSHLLILFQVILGLHPLGSSFKMFQVGFARSRCLQQSLRWNMLLELNTCEGKGESRIGQREKLN